MYLSSLNKQSIAIIAGVQLLLSACSPIKLPASTQYNLNAFSSQKWGNQKTSRSILVSQPEAMAGYQTDQMHYISKPFELNTFAYSTWVSTPATMLYPLIVQSLQRTGYFYAVVSGPYVDKADYRLDTQLIALQQNFLTKPSTMELVAKVMLTHIDDNRVVASRIIRNRVPCPADTPYGGVIAANKATQLFTASVSRFVVDHVKQDG